MDTQFPNLFSSIKIGSMIVKNRIVSPAHMTGYAADNMITDRLIRYHQARAEGGVGLIIMESTTVHPSYELYRPSRFHIHNTDDRIIPWFQKFANLMHEYDVKILAQISHGGGIGSSTLMFPLLAPSADIPETVCEMSRDLEIDEIEEIIQAFGQGARRAYEGGLDGVEILGAYGNLIPQFMNPHSNRRTDEYGGNFENRLRFALRIIDCIRENVDEDFTVGMRISGDEFVDHGLTLMEMRGIASALASKLDFLDVSFSSHLEFLSSGLQVPSTAFPLGAFVYLAAGIKEVVDIPVVAVGRINDPVQAEQILVDGYADLVAMARALICDPELPKKARENRLKDIRVCIGCKEGCSGHLRKGLSITCIQNPIAGREREWSNIEIAERKKKVVVIGGGPAGVEAAWGAAQRGHQVVLFEKNEQLGGQVLIAAKAPLRKELEGITRNLIQHVELEGERVTIKLGTEATVEMVMAEVPDAVIVATGSTPFIPPIIGVDSANVVTDWDTLQDKVKIGKTVVVLDGEGRHRACSVAEFLADKGHDVILVTRQYYVGLNLLSPDQSMVLQRLLEKKVTLKPHVWIKEIRENEITIYDTLTHIEEFVPVDTVVLAIGGKANYRLYKNLKGKVKELYAIGDCLAPRRLETAIHEGFNVGIRL